MDLKHCMNITCGASSVSMEWRRGWMLQSGDYAVLCDKCGNAYEQSKFCDMFHSNDPGWRQCIFCDKYLHCGCIVSHSLYVLHDTYGISCASCARKSRLQPVVQQNLSILRGKQVVVDCSEDVKPKMESHFHMGSSSSSGSPLAQTNLSMTLGAIPLRNSSIPFHSAAVVDGRESTLRGRKFHHILPRITMPGYASRLEANNASMELRTSASMAPPRSWERDQHLLDRYRPQMTNEELQQISGSSNSTVVPLFEKVLTATDAGPMGRIILPKACAEAYLPPISKPEGIPLEIHDVNRNVWKVQFKFWFNSNSRIYILEGVYPCIHSMQLKAGDTVTLNRMDPEGKLIMWVRRRLRSPPSAAQSPNRRNKRLKIENHDGLELKVPSVDRSVIIEGLRLEEDQEHPILVPRSIFLALSNRIIERWAYCKDCSKWRKIPADVLLPANWTCVDNIWDQSRSSCSVPNELTPMELENLLNMIDNKGIKKEAVEPSSELALEHELLSELHTLADAASSVLETNASNSRRRQVAWNWNMRMNQNRNQMMVEMNHQPESEAGTSRRR